MLKHLLDTNIAIYVIKNRPQTARDRFVRHQGQMSIPYDQMLAGHARALGLILVSSDVRVFKRVPGLRVETWIS